MLQSHLFSLISIHSTPIWFPFWPLLTVFDVWIVGPSAIGSVKGAPSSITSVEDVSEVFLYQCTKFLEGLTSATLLHSQQDIRSVLRRGVTSSDIGNERRLFHNNVKPVQLILYPVVAARSWRCRKTIVVGSGRRRGGGESPAIATRGSTANMGGAKDSPFLGPCSAQTFGECLPYCVVWYRE